MFQTIKVTPATIVGCMGLLVGAAGFGAAASTVWRGDAAQVPLLSTSPAALESGDRGLNDSLATGLIEPDVEGLFALDHLTGNLFCWDLNPRSGEVAAVFQTNVLTDLGVVEVEHPDYVMTTGIIDFTMGRTGTLRPAKCVVYVAESHSGRVAGYSLMYNRQAVLTGGAQAGNLQRVAHGNFRGELP